MIEISLNDGDPFRPRAVHKGHIVEVRDRQHPGDLMECDWEPLQLSVVHKDAENASSEANRNGWEARILPGIAEQATLGGQFTLHRLH